MAHTEGPRPRPTFPEEWLVAVLDCLDEGVMALSPTGEIVAANPSAERLLGFSIAVDRYQPFPALGCRFVDRQGEPLGPDDDPVMRTVRTGEPIRSEVVGIDDGPTRWLAFTTHLLPVETPGTSTDIVVSITDVTEQLSAERAKRDFLAMTSHELRTPVVALLGYGDLIESERTTDAERRHFTRSMVRQARHVLRLVDDLLVAARLDTGKLAAQPAAVDVNVVIEESLRSLRDAPVIDVDIPEGAVVFADPDHVRRLTLNLLENAVKYGAPPIAVQATHDRTAVEIAVVDHGTGVPEGFEPRLFEAFSQASEGSDRTSTGTGLGLAIVDGLARLNGGSVRYERNHPTGSRFTVRLPAVEL